MRTSLFKSALSAFVMTGAIVTSAKADGTKSAQHDFDIMECITVVKDARTTAQETLQIINHPNKNGPYASNAEMIYIPAIANLTDDQITLDCQKPKLVKIRTSAINHEIACSVDPGELGCHPNRGLIDKSLFSWPMPNRM